MTNLPFVFGLAFFLRIFVPGLVGGFIAAFFTGQQHWFRDLQGITTLVLLSGLIGMAMRVLYVFVGELLIGEYWPEWLRLWRVRVLESRLTEAQATLQHPPAQFFSNEGRRFFNAGRFVQSFPFDNSGRRAVAAPTLFGNIVAAPLARLAMQHGLKYMASRSLDQHLTFVLTRLWFRLPDKMRQEVADSFAETEALLGSLTATAIGAWAFLFRGLSGLVVLWRSPRGDFLSNFIVSRSAKDIMAALLLTTIAAIIYKVVLKRIVGNVAVYEAIFGFVSPAQLEEIIEKSKEALAPPAEAAHYEDVVQKLHNGGTRGEDKPA